MRISLRDVCNPSLLMNLVLNGLDDLLLHRGHNSLHFLGMLTFTRLQTDELKMEYIEFDSSNLKTTLEMD